MVVGKERLIVPVAFAILWPDPVGPGEPCRDKRHYARLMFDERLAAWHRRRLVAALGQRALVKTLSGRLQAQGKLRRLPIGPYQILLST